MKRWKPFASYSPYRPRGDARGFRAVALLLYVMLMTFGIMRDQPGTTKDKEAINVYGA